MRCNKGHRHSVTSAGSAYSLGGALKADRVGGLEVDEEFKIGCLHDRRVAGFSPSLGRPAVTPNMTSSAKRLTENELSDFSLLWYDGCSEAIIEAQYVDRNHASEV
jgi:hypothetical protein